MKNSAGRGGCYPPRLKAKVDNTFRDLQNSSYPTKAEFNNCFNIFELLKEKMSLTYSQPFRSLLKQQNLVPRFSRSMVQ